MAAPSPCPPDRFLAGLLGRLEVRLTQYDYQRYNVVVAQTATRVAGGSGRAALAGSDWIVTVEQAAVAGEPSAVDLVVRFRCGAGRVEQAAVAVTVCWPSWSSDNYVLLPSAAYQGNRFLSRRIPYSPKLYYVQDIGPDKPIIITDVPRLNDGPGPSRIQDRSGSLATPTVGVYAPRDGVGVLLHTTQGNALGDFGFDVEESRDRTTATLSVRAPVVRELHSYRICDAQHPSLDRGATFTAGDEVVIPLRLQTFAAADVQTLFDTFAATRTRFRPKRSHPDTLPYSACLGLLEEKFNRFNFVPAHGYYSVGPRQNFLQDWQIGWTGGMISTYPLLVAGGAETRANVRRNFDWLFPNGISPSGFFWDAGANGTQWIGGDIRKPHTGDWHLIRKSGDGVFYIVKQFRAMEQLGMPVAGAWRDGVLTVCDALMRLWRRHGQLGQFVHSVTGDVVVGGSASGAIVPAALALAADYFRRPDYLESACAIAEHLYQTSTRRGVTCGGPGDACQNPDSESGYGLIEAYVALFAATRDDVWLRRALEATRQFSTWVVSYDFAFPPQSTFGRADIRTTGAVYANTQNKHAAPGLCTFSGLGLLKLFRATGDRLPLELLHDIAHNIPQYLPHPARPLGDAVPGHLCERVNLTDWEGPERIGETLRMTTWAETSLMLTCVEIPGVYLQPDRGLVVAFDNVRAEIVDDSHTELAVRVTNPTTLPADVTFLAENAANVAAPLPDTAILAGPREHLAPGESRVLRFAKA